MDHDMSNMPGMEGGATDMNHGSMLMKMYVHGTIGGDVLWFRSWQPTSAGAYVGACIGLFLLAMLDRYLHALWRACTASWARGKVGFALPVAQGDEYMVRAEDEDDAGGVIPVSATATATEAGSCCERKKEKEQEVEKRASRDSFIPVTCQCGCGGECGASSAPVYRETATPESEKLEKPADKPGVLSVPVPGPAYLPSAARRTLDPRRKGRWSRPLRFAVDVPRGALWGVMTIIHYALMLVVMTFNIWFILSTVVGHAVGEALFGRLGAR